MPGRLLDMALNGFDHRLLSLLRMAGRNRLGFINNVRDQLCNAGVKVKSSRTLGGSFRFECFAGQLLNQARQLSKPQRAARESGCSARDAYELHGVAMLQDADPKMFAIAFERGISLLMWLHAVQQQDGVGNMNLVGDGNDKK